MVFTAENLYKSFGEKQVLQGVSFRAEGGRALGLLGRNGAGKTTTIRIIMGVFPPDGGTVELDGSPIRRGRVNFGYLPEEHGLYLKKPIGEQLVYLGRLRGMTGAQARASVRKWLGRLDMARYETQRLDTLSKGNQQKIQLAAALVTDPDFVILDEPFSGLDPVNAMVLKDVIRELIAAGKLVLFSSHQMNYVEEFCDSIVILNGGRIVLGGSLREIRRSYDRRTLRVTPSAARPQEAGALAAFCRDRLGDLTAGADTAGGDVRIHMRSADAKAAVMAALAGESFDLDSVRVEEPSLNDIFVQYTEGAV